MVGLMATNERPLTKTRLRRAIEVIDSVLGRALVLFYSALVTSHQTPTHSPTCPDQKHHR